MTQPISVPIDVQVNGADSGVADLNNLQAALAGVTVGAGAVDVGLRQVQSTTQRGTFGSRGISEAMSYQHQLSGIAATAAATRQSLAGLSSDVTHLARSMPGGTQQAIATVQATQQLGLSGRNQINQIRQLSGEFTKLAAATGSYAPALATEFGQLNRQLASLDPSRLSRFSDVVTTLQAKTGASVSGMLNFAQAISPVAQQAGLGESSILGISSAFVKLGDDGGAAATAVNKILGDLNSSVRTGSNQMVAYANATGMTVKQFKALFQANPGAALEKVTSQLGQPTAQSSYLLQTLGLDSVRTQRAFSELGQSGGLRQTIDTATAAYGNGSTQRAAAAAFNNVDDRMQQLSTTAHQLGESLSAPLLGPLGKFLSLVQGVAGPLASAVEHVTNNPIGRGLISTVGTTAFVGATAASGLFGLGRRMLGPAWAATLGTSGPAMGALAGFRSGRLGSDAAMDAAMNETGLLGFVGRRHNAMLTAAVNGEQMGRRSMAGINRGTFDFFSGLGEQFGPTGANPLTPRASLARRLMAGGATAASLANQGYWRMLQQPLVQARQSPLDREFMLTREGGPGRGLVSGLRDAYRDKDMASAGAALRTFTHEVSGGDKAVKRFATTMIESGANIVKLGLGAGAGVGRAGLGAVGRFVAGNPLMVAGGLALGGYELYQHSQDNAQRQTAAGDPSQMYAVLNHYRDSMGEAGAAAINLAQQMNDAAANIANNVTTFRQATHVSAADIHAFGLADPKKTINRMTGTAQQVASQIVALHAGQRMTPSDLQAIKHDLYNQGYMGPQIDRILALVPHGIATQTPTDIDTAITHASYQAGERHRGLLGKIGQGAMGVMESLAGPDGDSAWANVGRAGGGSPALTGTGHQLLAQMALGIKASANTNAQLGGGRYATGQEIKQANLALSDALKSHNASLVVATEQQLTRTLTGTAIKGMSALDIERAAARHPGSLGPLGSVLQGHGAKVNDLAVTTGLLAAAQQQQTATAVSSLAGQGRSMFAPYFGGANRYVQHAMDQPGDPGATQKAAGVMVTSMTRAGESLAKIASTAERNLNVTGPQGNVITAVLAQAQQQLAFRQIGMTSSGQIASNIRMHLGQAGPLPANASDAQVQARQTAIGGLQTDYQTLTNMYKQRIMAQYQYQIQSSRATEDFTIQRGRAEQDFQIQDLRNTQDYYRQKRRALSDFNLSVQREIEDAASSSAYSPYQRIGVQPTFGASDLAMNVMQQNAAIDTQVRNLHRVRSMGLSTAAVRTLGLADTANAQQLQQLVDDFARDPQLAAQMNREIQQRLKGTSALVKDSGNVTFERQRQDLQRSLARSEGDFQRSEDRMHSDFARNQARASDDFHRSMARMAQDLHTSDLEITGDMTTLQKDVNKIMAGQAVDFSHQLVNTFDTTLQKTKDLIPKLKHLASQGFNAVGASGSGFGRGAITGTPGGAGQPSGLHRAPNAAGVNTGMLLSDQSRPGSDTDRMGNPDLHWGTDIAMAPKKDGLSPNARMAMTMAAARGWKDTEWAALYQIWQQESGFNTRAGDVSHAYGIPQAYPGSKMASAGRDWLTNPATQIRWGLNYIAGRYGDPLGAWAHKSRTGWYGGGGIAMEPHIGVVAEAGSPEAMIPLNSHGVAYLAHAISKYISSVDAANIVSGGRGNSVVINANHYTENYGHSVAKVEVRANSVKEIWDAMDQKVRMSNLTGPRGVRKGPGS